MPTNTPPEDRDMHALAEANVFVHPVHLRAWPKSRRQEALDWARAASSGSEDCPPMPPWLEVFHLDESPFDDAPTVTFADELPERSPRLRVNPRLLLLVAAPGRIGKALCRAALKSWWSITPEAAEESVVHWTDLGDGRAHLTLLGLLRTAFFGFGLELVLLQDEHGVPSGFSIERTARSG